ncbi:MAG TPA: protein kinase, partial [Byssovorax sp.]
MGEVWRCFDMERRANVAIKSIKPELLQNRGAARMFHAEVVTTARLNHPGIVPVFDLIREGDATLLVMAFRDGAPLSRYASGSTPPAFAAVRRLLQQILSALAYAHAHGVLHLDIKPDNVVVERSEGAERATLVDFGIARVRHPGRGVKRWTQRDDLVGTVAYMAPEQCEGLVERFGPWTDLYAVGMLAYELCCGHRPFVEGEVIPTLLARLAEPAPRLVSTIAGVPAAFADVVDRLLQREPRDRPLCAADVLGALDALDAPAQSTGAPHATRDSGVAAVSWATLHVGGRGAHPADVAPAATAAARAGEAAPSSSPDAGAESGREPTSTRPSEALAAAFTADLDLPLAGAYGLFGLRELPVLGRVEERRAIWDAVHDTVVLGRTTAVLLDGPAGVGKSRLARDALERGAELGLVTALETSWSPDGSGDEGARALIENTFDTRGSTLEKLRERLAFWLERVPGDHASFAREVELFLRPPPGAQLDPGLPLRVAVEALERAAALRPVLLLLDDVQWSRGQATALVHALRAREPQPAVCVLATARADDADERAARNAFRELEGVAYVPVDPLDAAKTRQLVRGLLDVDDGLCDLLAGRAEGNPLFVTQLLGQLVVEDAVERRDGRFRLARAVDLAGVPADIASVWRRRIARSGAARRDLAALALVRQRVALDVAGALAVAMGGTFDDSITQALASGLVHLDDGEYRWAHGLLRDYLLRDIDADALPQLARYAATALEPLVGREDVQAERARHLASAGQHREACEALLSAAMWSFHRAEPAQRTDRFELLATWSDARRFADLAARARVELGLRAAEVGDAAAAEACVALAYDRLAATTDVSARAWVALQSSRIARLAGRLDVGAQRTQEALEAARAGDVPEVEGLALLMLGLDCFRSARLDEARSYYACALERFREVGSVVGEAQVLVHIINLAAPADALVVASRAIERAREAGALRLELMARQVSIPWLWE